MSHPDVFIGVDQGSSGSKVVLIDSAGEVLHGAAQEVGTSSRGANREQDPLELLRSIETLLTETLEVAAKSSLKVGAIGLACQRSGVLAWNEESGEILHPAMTWRDTRLQSEVEKLSGHTETISRKTGLPLNVHFAATKLRFLQEKFRGKHDLVGTLDTFLLTRLSDRREFCTDDTAAARTMLYDLKKATWDSELCSMFGVDIARLAKISPSTFPRGSFQGVPIQAVLGDQQAAYAGLNCGDAHPVLILGTVDSLMTSTGEHTVIKAGYQSSVLYSSDESTLYQIEATTNSSGPTIELLTKKMKFVSDPSDLDRLCKEASDDSVAFLPLLGTASPDWRVDLPAVIEDWNGDPAGFVRAAIESVGGFVALDILAFMGFDDVGIKDKCLIVSGGISKCDYLLQFISDCTGCEILRPELANASAFGAAVLAATASGFTPAPSFAQDTFFPEGKNARFEKWQDLRARVYRGEIEGEKIKRVYA